MRSALLGGYWGFGNVGDEAVAATVVDDLRAAWPGVRLILTSERPEATARRYGVEAIGWREITPLVEAIAASDHVVIGGGGLWNSYHPFDVSDPLRDSSNYAQHVFALPLLARLLGKPATIFAVGGGEVRGDAPRRLAALGAACAGTIVVRDARSRAFMDELTGASAGDPRAARLAADPAFRLSAPSPAEIGGLATDIVWADACRPIVAVAREWLDAGTDELVRDFAALLRAAALASGRPVAFVPFDVALGGVSHFDDDEGLAERIAAAMPGVETRIVRGEHHPRAVARLLESAAVVVSMRLHGCILSVRAGVPVLGLGYDPKVAAVMGDIGLGDRVVGLDAIGRAETARRLAAMADDPAERAAVAAARETAVAASNRGPALLAEALRAARRPPLPPEAEALRDRYAAGFLTVRAAVERRLPGVARIVREAVNAGRPDDAQPLAATLSALLPESGEWPYLDAIARAGLGAPPSETLRLLADAERRGFARAWVRHVAATERLRAGDVAGAAEELRRLATEAPDHPGLDALRAAVEAARVPGPAAALGEGT